MNELIKRSDAILIIQNTNYKYPTWPHIVEAKENMIRDVKSAPTIDAVPVVRCKDCKHNRNCFIKEMIIAETKQDNPYCSCGAKMEDKPCKDRT